MKIYADDGKEFKGVNPHHLVDECNAYEADIKLKKAQEETERKAKEQKLEKLFQSINENLKDASNDIKAYKKLSGDNLIIHYIGDGVFIADKYKNKDTYIFDCSNKDSFMEDIVNNFHKSIRSI